MKTFKLNYSTQEDCNCFNSHDTTFGFYGDDAFSNLTDAHRALKEYVKEDFEEANHPHTTSGQTSIVVINNNEVIDEVIIDSFDF